MSTDDFVTASELRNGPDVTDPSWTPGPALVAIEDAGDVTFFEDTEGIELLERWVTIDAAHAVPRGEMR